jgi:hypothetical protein
MSDPKDGTKEGESFFRKVARFVANPTTDWAEINSRQDDPEADAAKAELRWWSTSAATTSCASASSTCCARSAVKA